MKNIFLVTDHTNGEILSDVVILHHAVAFYVKKIID